MLDTQDFCQGVGWFKDVQDTIRKRRKDKPSVEEIGAAMGYSMQHMYRLLDEPKWRKVREIDSLASALQCTDEEHAELIRAFLCDLIFEAVEG